MTFGSREESRYLGSPIELYEVQIGETRLRYTDCDRDVAFMGNVYQAVPISRSAINASGALDKSALMVRTAKDTELGLVYGGYPPSEVINLVLRQGHYRDNETYGETDFLVSWTGRLLNGNYEGDEVVCQGEPISTSLRRNGLRRHYQYGCPHALYGPECRASRAAATKTAEVASVSGRRITLVGGWTEIAQEKYLGGLLTWTNPDGSLAIRTPVRLVSENVLAINGSAAGLEAGDTIEIALGCNHKSGLEDDCIQLHTPVDEEPYEGGNIRNFGGQPWIPTKNPIGLTNNFY